MKEEFYFDGQAKSLMRILSPKREDRILIVGTGTSPMAEYFLKREFNVKKITSIDVSKENITNAKRILPDGDFIFADANKKLPFKKNSFDKVIIAQVLPYLKNEESSLSEINRVLKKDGRMVLSVPKGCFLNIINPVILFQRKREYQKENLNNILKKANFKEIIFSEGGGIYDLLNLITHCIFKYCFRTYHANPFKIFLKGMDRSWEGKSKGIVLMVECKKK